MSIEPGVYNIIGSGSGGKAIAVLKSNESAGTEVAAVLNRWTDFTDPMTVSELPHKFSDGSLITNLLM